MPEASGSSLACMRYVTDLEHQRHFPPKRLVRVAQDRHLKKGTIIKRDFGLGIGYPSIVKYLEAI